MIGTGGAWGYGMLVNGNTDTSQAYPQILHPGTRTLFRFWEKIRGENCDKHDNDGEEEAFCIHAGKLKQPLPDRKAGDSCNLSAQSPSCRSA